MGDIFGWIADKLLAPALVAVVFSGAVNILMENHKSRRDLRGKIFEELRKALSGLNEKSRGYWARTGKAGDLGAEAEILALQTEIVELISVLRDEFKVDIFEGHELDIDLADAVSGGNFATKKRPADPARVRRISGLISDMRDYANRSWVRLHLGRH